MLTFGRALGLIVPVLSVGVMGACSAGNKAPNDLHVESGGSTGAGATGAGGSTGGSVVVSGGAGGTVGVTGGAAGSAGTSGAGGTMIQECAGDVEMGMPVPVDVYVMLDISGSMLDPSGTSGTTKWDAVKSALSAFFGDAQSAGLSVAIQYFPLRTPGAPTSCTSDADCGAAGPCLLDVCQQTPQVFVACTPSADPADTAPCTNAIQKDDGPCTNQVCHLSGKACTTETDCQTVQAALGKCLQFGSCAGDPTLSCGISNPGFDQPGCGANNTAGMCVAATSSFCVHETLCDPDAYAMPAVDFLTLPDTAGVLNASIAMQMPAGDTPTRQALLGAIAHARAHAAANIGHSAVIVLATDGLPTDCTGGREVSGESTAALNDVVGVVTEGNMPKNATDASVETFVIGVFADSEQASAQTNLDMIAMAGGTDHAFVASSGGDVQQEFLTDLNSIRAARLSCEFQIPKPTSGSTLDIHQVNVELTSDTTPASELYYVTPNGCTGASDEWHYDAEPNPTKLVACPNTCSALKMATNAQVSVKLGCMQHVR
jgi:von Willebrand factor type A domain